MSNAANNAAYSLTVIMKPNATQEDVDHIKSLVGSLVGNENIYHTEQQPQKLSYLISDQSHATVLVISYTGPTTSAKAIASKIKYEPRSLRARLTRDKQKHTAPRLQEAPLKPGQHFTNPSLRECTDLSGRIAPRRVTGLSAKDQRAVAKRIKTARTMGMQLIKAETV